jgi:hypothetical protein
MLLNPAISANDVDNLTRSIKSDLDCGNLKIYKPNEKKEDWTVEMTNAYRGEKVLSYLQKTVEHLLNNAFKEGCKCGKGGFSPMS